MQPITIEYKGFTITTDKTLMIPADVHQWLSEESYWAKMIPLGTVLGAMEHSYCIGVLKNGRQVGFARLVTDYHTFGYLADVFVRKEYRGIGLSKKMMEILTSLDWVKELRRVMLATIGGHGLYSMYGFTLARHPERLMEITRLGMYSGQSK